MIARNTWYRVMRRARFRCESCGRGGRLDIHHLTYANVPNELPEDLQALCRSCHDAADAIREQDSAIETFGDRKYGDRYNEKDRSEVEDEFNKWRDRKESREDW